jgi:hypothetical protein
MKIILKYILTIVILSCISNSVSYGQLKYLFKKTENLLRQNKNDSNDTIIIDGLKEALSIGSKNAVGII